jgi:predicted short-subunit dehydrogenase-like oxidoreductase (DUF2520 family)
MKDQTAHYAIIGDGRLARHMKHYLGLLGLAHGAWARNPHSTFNDHRHPNAGERLAATLEPASHVLLLVSDDAIAELLRRFPALHGGGRRLVHCAGALSLPGVAGAHPLMTFGDDLYDLERYQSVPFLVESGYRFGDLMPGLPNPSHSVPTEQKALYHALCVMAGNFPQILWRGVEARFRDRLQLPREVLEPYLRQVLDNFLRDPQGALTGPLARGDAQTMTRNLAALGDDPMAAVYAAFQELHAADAAARTDSGMIPALGREVHS